MEDHELPEVDVNQQQIAFHGNMDNRACFQYFTLNQMANGNQISGGHSGRTKVETADAPRFGKMALKAYIAGKLEKEEARELMAFMKFSHPNKVTFYGLVFDNDPDVANQVARQISGFVMEYMEGGCLHEAIHKKPLMYYDKLRAISWAMQACRALSYLHLHNVMHRDVKPANMMLSLDKKVLKIGDFRSSRTLSADSKQTASVGPLRYAAPEVIRTEGDVLVVYNYKCDTYSMAITFNEILTRKTPYTTGECATYKFIELRKFIIKGSRPEINHRGTQCEKGKTITKACWVGNVDERKDMDWMLQQLEELLQWYVSRRGKRAAIAPLEETERMELRKRTRKSK